MSSLEERCERGRSLVLGYELATRRMRSELNRVKQSIALDAEALRGDIRALALELEAAKAEIARLQTMLSAESPSTRLH